MLTLRKVLIRILQFLVWCAIHLADLIVRLPAKPRHRNPIRRWLRRWRMLWATSTAVPLVRRRRASNRTPNDIEEALVRLHVEQPRLGAGQLCFLLERTSGWRMARETVRKILLRRQDLVVELRRAKRRTPGKITVRRPLSLWGLDLTLIWVLGIFPVWVLGVVDYHGSHLVVMERLLAPTTAEVERVLRRTFAEQGKPKRILTDNGSIFTGLDFELLVSTYDIEHTTTLPAHPWTNGRIERLFRTLKEAILADRWLITSIAQLDRLLRDFSIFYNRDRPHASLRGRTPDEVYFHRRRSRQPLGRVTYFDGALNWYRLG